jgi:hypothetical protein
MARSAVDLPDPAGKQPDADELLAQLASQQIDRLLSDADLKDALPDDSSPAISTTTRTDPESDKNPIQDELDRLFADSETAGRVASRASNDTDARDEASAAESSESDLNDFVPEDSSPDSTEESSDEASGSLVGEALQSQLDDLFRELSEEPAPTSPAALRVSGPATESHASPASDATHAYDAQQPASQTLVAASIDARSPIDTAQLSTEPSSTLLPSEVRPDGRAVEVPIWLKPLVWLNAPFAGLDDPTRALIGKIAVLTLINAIAAILVVILLRR